MTEIDLSTAKPGDIFVTEDGTLVKFIRIRDIDIDDFQYLFEQVNSPVRKRLYTKQGYSYSERCMDIHHKLDTNSPSPKSKMPITTIKRVQSDRDWWYTIEDCNSEVDEDPQTGLYIKYHDDSNPVGRMLLSVNKEDALLIRDAINQLYPS